MISFLLLTMPPPGEGFALIPLQKASMSKAPEKEAAVVLVAALMVEGHLELCLDRARPR